MTGRLLVNHSPYWLLWPLGCESFLYGLFKSARPAARGAGRRDGKYRTLPLVRRKALKRGN